MMATREQALAVLVVTGWYWQALRGSTMGDAEAVHRYPELFGASIAPIGFLIERAEGSRWRD